MTKKETFCEAEKRRFDKMNKFQLPNRFKKIGWSVVILAFLLMIANKFIDQTTWIKPLLRNLMVVGLLLISLAKEKIDDELVQNMRAQSYRMAFIFGVIYAVVQPTVEYGVDALFSKEPSLGFSYFQLLIFMLFVQLAFFESLKRYNS